jgi:hypothetical protein
MGKILAQALLGEACMEKSIPQSAQVKIPD